MRSITMDTNMHRDKNMRVRQSHPHGHRDHGQVQEEDHMEIGRQQKRVFSQESCRDHSKDLKKKRPSNLEVDDSPPLLPSSTDSDITSLPRDAVFCILDKLLEPIDHLRVATVSKEWDAVAKDYNHSTQRWSKEQQQVPMLMIPTGTEGQQKLYSVTERRIYDHIRLPIPYNDKTCCGSNYGWLAIIDKSLEEIRIPDVQNSPFEDVVITYRITLQNPFRTGIEAIHLPPLKYNSRKSEKQYKYIIPHVILSADPTLHPENYAVLAFCNHHLPFALIKGGQKTWVQFTSLNVEYNISMYSSAIFCRNQIYAIHDFGALMMKADVSNSSTPIHVDRLLMANRTGDFTFRDESYLVESTTGDLLCVRRPGKTDYCGEWLPFRVYKIVFSEKDDEFYRLEIENIGDEAIFLDYSLSICVSASKFPGCQPNSIYYTTNDPRKLYRAGSPPKTTIKCEMGVYNLDTKVMTTLYSSEDEGCWNNYMPHWVLPCFKL